MPDILRHPEITLHTGPSMLIIRRKLVGEFPMTWPEANQLQADIRALLTANGITTQDAF